MHFPQQKFSQRINLIENYPECCNKPSDKIVSFYRPDFWKAIAVFRWLISSCSTFCHEKWHPFDQVYLGYFSAIKPVFRATGLSL
ncbi:hypothetical protein OC25_16370 [Pedobacter kyungheensis]|uniref:Uncharacterized protein n=1 Tax=Pedobacter kyungheensis TaxID=1069985 RepID=A0A0C1FXL7_9SPHI|nr:hypothetical protein OC25_16370 [Pedobacter kyungheensis]